MQPALLATLGAMMLILAIGCANVASLVLGQVDARSPEFAIRAAVGARRSDLQQLVVEVLLVAFSLARSARARAGRLHRRHGALPLGAWAPQRQTGAVRLGAWPSPAAGSLVSSCHYLAVSGDVRALERRQDRRDQGRAAA